MALLLFILSLSFSVLICLWPKCPKNPLHDMSELVLTITDGQANTAILYTALPYITYFYVISQNSNVCTRMMLQGSIQVKSPSLSHTSRGNLEAPLGLNMHVSSRAGKTHAHTENRCKPHSHVVLATLKHHWKTVLSN